VNAQTGCDTADSGEMRAKGRRPIAISGGRRSSITALPRAYNWRGGSSLPAAGSDGDRIFSMKLVFDLNNAMSSEGLATYDAALLSLSHGAVAATIAKRRWIRVLRDCGVMIDCEIMSDHGRVVRE